MGEEELAAEALVVERNRIRHSRGGTMARIIAAISSGGSSRRERSEQLKVWRAWGCRSC
jgi:hypothetical protein